MVATCDGGDHSDILLKSTSCLEHSGMLTAGLISLVRGRAVGVVAVTITGAAAVFQCNRTT